MSHNVFKRYEDVILRSLLLILYIIITKYLFRGTYVFVTKALLQHAVMNVVVVR